MRIGLSGHIPQRGETAVEESRVLGPIVQFLRCDSSVMDLVACIAESVYLVSTLEEAEQLFEQHGGRAAFVTLDGQLLEAGGVMHGGKAKTAGAHLLGQKRQIRNLEKEVASLQEKHDALAERFSHCLSKYQSYIFHRMVKIDVYVSFGMQEKIKKPMDAKQDEHVIKKRNSTGYLRFPLSVQL